MKLGDPVRFTAIFQRAIQYNERRNTRVYWETVKVQAPTTGILIGLRTLSNGESWWESEVGYVYEAKEHIKAALVAFSLRRKPVLVPLDDLTVLLD